MNTSDLRELLRLMQMDEHEPDWEDDLGNTIPAVHQRWLGMKAAVQSIIDSDTTAIALNRILEYF